MAKEEQYNKGHIQMEKSLINSERCDGCHGSGMINGNTCSSCNGRGEI
jgi:DnaJ-class molecular chaperone